MPSRDDHPASPAGQANSAGGGELNSRSAAAGALLRFDTGVLSDAVERVHGPAVPLGIRSLCPKPRRIAGRAVTVRLGPPRREAPVVHLGARAIDSARAGDVMVIANDGRLDAAVWGGLLSAGAALRGVAGIVIDGACRDVDELLDLELEVFSKGIVPLTARGRVVEHSFGEAVMVSGVCVRPGDWVIGDASGVVIVPAGEVESVVSVAREIALCESALHRAIVAGRPVSEVLDATYESLLEGGG